MPTTRMSDATGNRSYTSDTNSHHDTKYQPHTAYYNQLYAFPLLYDLLPIFLTGICKESGDEDSHKFLLDVHRIHRFRTNGKDV